MDLSQLFQQMLVKHREFEVDIEMFILHCSVRQAAKHMRLPLGASWKNSTQRCPTDKT